MSKIPVQFRLDKNINSDLNELSIKLIRKKTNIIEIALMDFIEKHKKVFSQKKTKYQKEFERKKQFLEESHKVKEKNRCYYLLKNGLKTIFEICSVSNFMTNEPNMNVVSNMVDNYLELFKTFPPDIKRRMKKDMETFKELKNSEFLAEKINKIGLIKLLKK